MIKYIKIKHFQFWTILLLVEFMLWEVWYFLHFFLWFLCNADVIISNLLFFVKNDAFWSKIHFVHLQKCTLSTVSSQGTKSTHCVVFAVVRVAYIFLALVCAALLCSSHSLENKGHISYVFETFNWIGTYKQAVTE